MMGRRLEVFPSGFEFTEDAYPAIFVEWVVVGVEIRALVEMSDGKIDDVDIKRIKFNPKDWDVFFKRGGGINET
jgi:hypothetical protein